MSSCFNKSIAIPIPSYDHTGSRAFGSLRYTITLRMRFFSDVPNAPNLGLQRNFSAIDQTSESTFAISNRTAAIITLADPSIGSV